MLNEESIFIVDQSHLSPAFKKPLFDSFSFSRIPATIHYLLTGKGQKEALPPSCYQMDGDPYDGVIVFFLDALGWSFFQEYCEHPFLQRFIEKGIASKISTQFPSTTAAHVSTIHTGLEVGQTGIYEWFQYEPLVDRMIAPLLFSYAGDPSESTLLASGHEIKAFFPFTTIYEKMHQEKIESYLFQDKEISPSPYSQAFGFGAHPIAFSHFSQGLKDMKELFQKERQNKIYAFSYYAKIDSMGHRKGIASSHFRKAVLHCLDSLEKEFMSFFSSLSKKIALLITADHGMVQVSPTNTIYINQLCPELLFWSKKNKANEILAPAGSCRDLFLHIQEEYLDKAVASLRGLLNGKAEVWRVEDLIQEGVFGQNLSLRFLHRVGNLVILPYKGEAVWWFCRGKFQQNFFGAHGGLTPEESESIFLFLSS